ncbi:MAG: TIGR03546 family protein [Treponema sp.]|nr:TIGR03546 family protein [Treponema sp.]
MLKYSAKLIVALNGNLSRADIAAGFVWGLFLGLIPVGNIFWVLLFITSFLFKHHHPTKLLSMAILRLFSPAFAPIVDMLGWEVLHLENLQPFFTSLYNMPLVPLTKFNNTLVAGGIAGGLILSIPVYIAVYFIVPLYRQTIAPKVRENKLVKAIKKVPLITKLKKLISKILYMAVD